MIAFDLFVYIYLQFFFKRVLDKSYDISNQNFDISLFSVYGPGARLLYLLRTGSCKELGGRL